MRYLNTELTIEDRQFIWQVVNQAVEKAGSHALLFANQTEFFEKTGRIRSIWPHWLNAVKGYLIFQYGETKTASLLFSILRTIRNEVNYNVYLRSINKNEAYFNKHIA